MTAKINGLLDKRIETYNRILKTMKELGCTDCECAPYEGIVSGLEEAKKIIKKANETND